MEFVVNSDRFISYQGQLYTNEEERVERGQIIWEYHSRCGGENQEQEFLRKKQALCCKMTLKQRLVACDLASQIEFLKLHFASYFHSKLRI